MTHVIGHLRHSSSRILQAVNASYAYGSIRTVLDVRLIHCERVTRDACVSRTHSSPVSPRRHLELSLLSVV